MLATVAGTPSARAQAPSSSPAGSSVSSAAAESSATAPATKQAAAQDKKPADNAAPLSGQNLQLPVSLDKIRSQLAQPPVEALKGLNDTAHFRVVIQEQQKFEDLLATLKFETGGPPVPGGRDMYDQQQRLFPSVNNPLAQPYAAFTQGELLQVLITSMVERLFAGRIVNSITAAERANAEARARAEAGRAIADYCAAQPGSGADIKICQAQ